MKSKMLLQMSILLLLSVVVIKPQDLGGIGRGDAMAELKDQPLPVG